jgi:hypothetical protein
MKKENQRPAVPPNGGIAGLFLSIMIFIMKMSRIMDGICRKSLTIL